MSTTHSGAQNSQSNQPTKNKQRKRKARSKSRTPEPKNIVSGAGQPLDLSVRRELEEQLGHDFSRVRLHTDRDAGALTDLLGADAVAVGQDIFFREGTYRPGTTDGQRLLAHELLHTVQNPDGLGALRAGRDLGAVSLPQQAMEREAESAAQDLVRDGEPAADVRRDESTPGWLRYATVDADRRRMEELDPATVIDRLANGVLRSLRGDPEDRSGRVRLQLARMAPQVQDIVLDRLELRLPTPALDRLLDLVEETEQGPLPLEAAGAPMAVPGEAEDVAQERERESAQRRGDARKPNEDRREPARQDERDRPGEGGGRTGAGDRDGADVSASPEQVAAQNQEEAAGRQQDRSQSQQQDRDASARDDKDAAAQEDRQKAQEDGQRDDATAAEQEQEEGAGSEDEAPQEPERQAGERQPGQDEASTVARSAAAAPAAADRSGTEPGEKLRTGGDTRPARTAGDPENEQDADDEPLGLESEPTEEEPAADEDTAGSGARGADSEPSGLDTADDPRLFRLRKKGEPRQPGISSTEGDAEPDALQDVAEPEESPAVSERTDEEDSESRTVQELWDVMAGEQDLGPEGEAGVTASPGSGAAVADSTERDWAKRQTEEEGREDAESRRRDEEARTADGAAQVPAAGEPAAPEQLAKAGEDARTQGAASSSAGGGAAESRTEGAGKPEGAASGGTTGRSEPESATGAGKGAEKPSDKAEDAGGRGGSGSDQGAPSPTPTPTPVPGGQDVTEGGGHATSPTPQTGPDQVAAPGPTSAPELAPGNGPAPMAGPGAKTNSPKASGASGSGSGSGARPRPTGAKRQAARQAAKTVRRSGGGGGSSRSAPPPAPARGGGRAGASGSAKPKKETPAPDVSNATPESGLATAAGLKPHQALETLKGVDGAVGRSVDKERTTLRKAPPKTQRPSGSPRTVPGGPTAAAPGTYTNAKVARTEAARGSTPEITGEQKPEGELPGANVPEPSWWDIAVTIGAQLFGSLLKEILPLDDLIDSILGLPTKDEGLQNARVGDAPRLPLENDSDPRRTDEQSQKLDERKTELHQSGRTDAGLPMGEDQIYPDVPKETLTGKVPGGKKSAKASGPRSVSGGVPIESASAVAEHDRGPQIQAGFAEGRGRMTQERRSKDEKTQQDKQKYDQDLQREVSASGKKQADARDKGRSDISDSRADWRKEQDDKVAEIDGKKGKKYEKVRQDITDKEKKTDEDVDKRTEDDNQRIADEQTNAEQEAEQKQEDGKDDADNWLEEAIEKLKDFFEELKNAIKTVFERARQVVTDLIDRFKQAVLQLIDDARNWVIDQINTFADALIALGDELLADYPAMRDKWRNTIDGARDWAVEKVNEFADALKEVAGKLLDGLCGALLAGLDLLETGLLAAVDVAESVTVGALEFGAAVVQGLGEWAAIFNDIVSDPGDWISKAGAAAETGARDHLFEEIKTAVKAWFNQKVQEIIGIPMEDFQALLDGGVTAEQMGQMAWDEALPQLPLIIGVLVVEKVVAKLIPGAGWVMAVIDALQTAWGALSEILAAFGLFMDFLKSVKSGNGALPFAKAVAAGVVALLELVYQFLIEGVGRFMGKVADRLGDMLKNLRKKKNPGQSDTPGQPDAPGKPKDDEPSTTNRPADRTDPRKPTPDQTSRPQPKPRPGKRSTPGKKPRPSHTTRPKKRREDDERREEGREVNAARRRARDAEQRTRDDDRDDRTGGPTRRGPARDTLRPDRRRPGTDRTNDRDRDPGSTRPGDRRTDDKRRTDDDRRDDRHRDTDSSRDRRSGDRPRRRPLRRARQTVKSAVNRARRATSKLFGKARRKLGSRLNDRLRRLRDLWRRRRDRMRDDRSRRPGRDRRDGGTESVELPKVRYADADDGERHTLMFHGRGMDAGLYVHSIPEGIPEFLADWRADIDKQDPSPEKENQEFSLKAAAGKYNKAMRIQKGIPAQVKKEDRDKYKDRRRALRKKMAEFAHVARLRQYNDIPEPKFPDFHDVSPVRGSAGHLSEYLGTSAKTVFGGPGEIARKAKSTQPPGWSYIDKNGLGENSAWVKMHLLPERLGGRATGNNLVPARGPQTNNLFLRNIEDQAYNAIPRQEKIIWYKTEVRFGHSRLKDFVDFPSYIYSAYGGYEQVRGTGKNRSDWTRKGQEKQFGRNVAPPRQDEGGTLFINTAGRTTIAGMLECSERLAQHVIDARANAGKFNDLKEIKPILRTWKRTNGGTIMPRLEAMLPNLDALIGQGKVDLSV
ncbi:DUF4157 domain-containing protein [Streptomyces scopuliridis]|uniref:DUF4157 domain-containing protein n=1 Tax=Streptomyces scopuliridis TaxID=452529 RepID=A0ACD4ZDZ6_9ACTN|nr:DUF4157 domain-containing protein [Streptomyces scopuliridis]WSB96537.1 DUF4157 domain-containing protein [Streptomyces scopuliridis]WSC09759.1 DUF4157 domain-containing protein [Streptomyces scopuliridis]